MTLATYHAQCIRCEWSCAESTRRARYDAVAAHVAAWSDHGTMTFRNEDPYPPGTDPEEAQCARDGHDWVLLDDDPDWYDGRTYECPRCGQIAYCCINGPEGNSYQDPEHDPGYLAIGHEWILEPQPEAPCAPRMSECVHCHLRHPNWPDVDHVWVNDNPNPSLSDPEWAMAVGLVDWTGTRRCLQCGVAEYKNPSF